jgi:hypothetical protein
VQQGLGARRGQRIEPELGVVGFARPAVLIFGAVADEQEYTGCREPFDQVIEEGLGLTVYPVEVLDHQDQGPDLTLAQQQMLDGLHEALAALRRVERLP